MADKNKKLKYFIDTACQNVPCLLLWLNPCWKKMPLQLALNKTKALPKNKN